MKHALHLALILAGLVPVAFGGPSEGIALAGRDGRPVATIDGSHTIRLADGQPVAYLVPLPVDGFDIYGFNGTHLGWYTAGVVRDHQGASLGARIERFTPVADTHGRETRVDPLPERAPRQPAPYPPFFTGKWSNASLERLLLTGSADGC